MHRFTALALVVTLFAGLPSTAFAAGRKTVGASLLIGGVGLGAAAFNWRKSCPDGYSTHTFEGLETQCVYLHQFGSDVRTAETRVKFKRPGLAWAGGAAALTGIVRLLIPNRPASPSITFSITPTGVRATKTIGF
ncbi:MAG: hypothetical protein AB7P99_10500 [Vicinamibacterales bacterium]